MPSTPKRPNAPQNDKPAKSKASKASFFGVIIMLSLLLTILGVLYIAYTSINNELKKVLAVNEQAMSEVSLLKEGMSELQKNMASGGQGELFEQLQQRVKLLEAEVQRLKNQPVVVTETQETLQTEPLSAAPAQLPPNVVTTEILEQKLQEYTLGLDKKLEVILKRLAQAPASQPATAEVAIREEVQQALEVPQPVEPSVKPLKQPVVRLVETVQAPAEPEAAPPAQNFTGDVKWLVEEPALNYTLQLASMQERSSVEKMIRQKGLEGARIIPMERKGEPYFVLLTGSYASRSEADSAAKRYKKDFGIAPWVRKIKDLSSKVQ